MRKGLLMLFAANAKGNVTTAMGQVFRAMGHGLKVCVIQFGQGNWNSGGQILSDRFADLLEFHVIESNSSGRSEDREEEIQAGREAWRLAKEAVSSGRFRIVVLENFTRLLSHHIVDEEEVVRCLQDRPSDLHVVVTGGEPPSSLIEAADLVTEVRTVRNP
jgi:cob(I)alamin adenosyltransferase